MTVSRRAISAVSVVSAVSAVGCKHAGLQHVKVSAIAGCQRRRAAQEAGGWEAIGGRMWYSTEGQQG